MICAIKRGEAGVVQGTGPAPDHHRGMSSIMADDENILDLGRRFARIETALAGLATKSDLEVAVATAAAGLATKADLASVAKNIDITALGRQIGEMRDELRVTSAIVLRLDHMWPDIIEQLRAMVKQQIGIIDRVRALEEPQP